MWARCVQCEPTRVRDQVRLSVKRCATCELKNATINVGWRLPTLCVMMFVRVCVTTDGRSV
jgi:hypothetical protein